MHGLYSPVSFKIIFREEVGKGSATSQDQSHPYKTAPLNKVAAWRITSVATVLEKYAVRIPPLRATSTS